MNFLTCVTEEGILYNVARGGIAESWIGFVDILQPLEPELDNASEGKRHGRFRVLRFVLGGPY